MMDSLSAFKAGLAMRLGLQILVITLPLTAFIHWVLR